MARARATKPTESTEDNALILTGGGAPPALSDWEAEMMGEVKAGVAKLSTGGQFLSMRAKKWSFGGQDLGDYVDIIPIEWSWTYAYYGNQKFDINNPMMPFCFAISKLVDGRIDHDPKNLAPEIVPDKQSEQCNGCPHNDFGSGDGRGKACKNTIRLSCLLVGAETVKAVTDPLKAPQVIFPIPPTNLKEFGIYQRNLSESHTPPFWIVSRLTFDDSFDFPHALFAANRHVFSKAYRTRTATSDKVPPMDLAWAERIKGAWRSALTDVTSTAWPTNASNTPSKGGKAGGKARSQPKAETNGGGKPKPKFSGQSRSRF